MLIETHPEAQSSFDLLYACLERVLDAVHHRIGLGRIQNVNIEGAQILADMQRGRAGCQADAVCERRDACSAAQIKRHSENCGLQLRAVAQHLAQDGEVSRGTLGVSIQELTPALLKALKAPKQQGGVLVTAVSNSAFEQAVGMLRRGGFMSLVGLPPGSFPLPIFEIVLKRITVRGSIVGTRNDLAEALAFAGSGQVTSHFSWDKLENINAIFDKMRAGRIDGRIVMEI